MKPLILFPSETCRILWKDEALLQRLTKETVNSTCELQTVVKHTHEEREIINHLSDIFDVYVKFYGKLSDITLIISLKDSFSIWNIIYNEETSFENLYHRSTVAIELSLTPETGNGMKQLFCLIFNISTTYKMHHKSWKHTHFSWKLVREQEECFEDSFLKVLLYLLVQVYRNTFGQENLIQYLWNRRPERSRRKFRGTCRMGKQMNISFAESWTLPERVSLRKSFFASFFLWKKRFSPFYFEYYL